MSVDILTNEGVRAINHTITTAVKLKIEEAVLVMYADTLTPQTAAILTYTDLITTAPSPNKMIPTSCLPCAVSQPSAGDPSVMEGVSALDIEFTYLPNSSVTYNLIGVCARYYYEISEYGIRTYSVGDVVSYGNGYYKCIQGYTAVADGSTPLTGLGTYWESVTVDTESLYPTNVPNKEYKALSSEPPILLYVSQLGNPVTLSKSLEVDYKLRLYLTNVATAEEMQKRIYFDTLGPEFSSSAQLDTLATIASIFSRTRDLVSGMVASGATFNLVTPGAATSEEEEMRIAYFKTQAITEHEFTGEAADSEVSPTDPLLLNLNRMDSGIDGVNYLSVVSTTGKINRIKTARVSMGGSGVLESRAVKAAVIYMQAVIPASASTRSEDYVIGNFTVTLSRWGEWEDKDIELFVLDNVSEWKPQYRNTKPMALRALNTSVFYVQDFNIQDDFVKQTLPIYLELGISADIILGSDMTTILD